MHVATLESSAAQCTLRTRASGSEDNAPAQQPPYTHPPASAAPSPGPAAPPRRRLPPPTRRSRGGGAGPGAGHRRRPPRPLQPHHLCRRERFNQACGVVLSRWHPLLTTRKQEVQRGDSPSVRVSLCGGEPPAPALDRAPEPPLRRSHSSAASSLLRPPSAPPWPPSSPPSSRSSARLGISGRLRPPAAGRQQSVRASDKRHGLKQLALQRIL